MRKKKAKEKTKIDAQKVDEMKRRKKLKNTKEEEKKMGKRSREGENARSIKGGKTMAKEEGNERENEDESGKKR